VTTGSLNLLAFQMSDLQKNNSFLFLNDHDLGSLSIDGESVMSPTTIASTFRLFASLERKNILILKDYIGLPILTIKKDEIYKFGNMLNESVNETNDTTMSASFDTSNLSTFFNFFL
jgi:hypothetical protein